MPSPIHEHRYPTHKGPNYYRVYEQKFSQIKDQPVRLLELGVAKGGSLEVWRDYFPQGTIVGLDQSPPPMRDPSGRIHQYQGLQQDIALLDEIGKNHAPEGFDIIIDDASHIAEYSRISFWHLLAHHLKPRGLYIIEDWGTGYWNYWPDGAAYNGTNHTAGMVGFIKEIVDEVGSVDHISDNNPSFMAKPSQISSLELCHGLAFIQKNDIPSVRPMQMPSWT